MNKKFILSIIIFLLITIGLGFFYVIVRNDSNYVNLISFLPNEANVLVQYDLAKIKTLEAAKENNSLSLWQKIISSFNIFPNWSSDLQKEIKKIGYVIVENESGRHFFWLIEVKNVRRAYAFLPDGYANKILNASVIALAKDKNDLSLAGTGLKSVNYNGLQIKDETLEKFYSDNFFNVYLSSDYTKKYFGNLKFDFWQDFNFSNPVIFGLHFDDNQIVFNLETASKEKVSDDFKKEDQIFAPLNQSLLSNLFLVLKSSDSQDFFDILSNNGFLNKDTLTEVKDIFQGPVVFFSQIKNVVGTDLKPVLTLKDAIKLNSYDYGLAFKLSKNKTEAEELDIAKAIIKKVLSLKYPDKKTKKLQDGSTMTELVADENIFEFKADGILEYVDNKNVNLALAVKDGYLILTNSQDLLKNIMTLSESDKENSCWSFDSQEIIYLKTKQLENGWLNLMGNIKANVRQEGDRLEIGGCIE